MRAALRVHDRVNQRLVLTDVWLARAQQDRPEDQISLTVPQHDDLGERSGSIDRVRRRIYGEHRAVQRRCQPLRLRCQLAVVMPIQIARQRQVQEPRKNGQGQPEHQEVPDREAGPQAVSQHRPVLG